MTQLNQVKLDKEGFLQNFQDWTPEIAPQLAEQDAIKLTQAHWEVIHLVRNYYEQFHVSPVTRVLVKLIADEFGSDKGKSIYLMTLFSAKPAKLVAKISGLPKPNNCD